MSLSLSLSLASPAELLGLPRRLRVLSAQPVVTRATGDTLEPRLGEIAEKDALRFSLPLEALGELLWSLSLLDLVFPEPQAVDRGLDGIRDTGDGLD